MKTLKVVFTTGLVIAGLSLTSCSKDDDMYMPPITPPIEADVQNPIYDTTPNHPIERPEVVHPIEIEPSQPIENTPENPIELE